MRVSSCGSWLARSSARYPVFSTTASSRSDTPVSSRSATARSSSSSAVKPLMALTERVAMAGASSGRPRAAMKGMRSRSARAEMQASARSPMPRLGTLMIRRRLTVSVGLDMTRR